MSEDSACGNGQKKDRKSTLFFLFPFSSNYLYCVLVNLFPLSRLTFIQNWTKYMQKYNEVLFVMVYSILDFMGLNFIMVFLVKKLPSTFKNLNLPTAVFCPFSVFGYPLFQLTWTQKENTSYVEVFFILFSTAGLLGYIFLTRCYKIILRPKLKDRRN